MSKISQLVEDTTPTHDDLIETVNDPAGTPVSRKAKLSNLFFVLQRWVFGEDAGSTDTYVVTLSPAPTSYVVGQHYRFKANTANTGACTVNFNGLGAKTIKKAAGGITTDLADNDIRVGQWVDLVYDGTNMQMQSLLGNAPAGGAGGIGDVVGPGSATDNALARFDLTTGKLIQNSALTADDNGVIGFPDNVRQTFNPGTNAAGLNVGSLAGDPDTPLNGDLWYDSTANELTSRINGANVVLGSGGGSIAPLEIVDANTVRQINGSTAQTLRVYQDASIFFFIKTVSSAFEIGSADVNTKIVVGTTKYEFTSGEIKPSTNVSLGTSSNRFGSFWGQALDLSNGAEMRFGSGNKFIDTANGWMHFQGSVSTTATKLSFGANNSAGPMIKRAASGTNLEFKLADDSAYTNVAAAKYFYGDPANNVFDGFGSGTPEGAVTAAVGSTYRRTDGGAGTSFYVKESGAGNTGWVAK
jgi:hypothetical protein